MGNVFAKITAIVVIVFVLFTALLLVGSSWLNAVKIKHNVVIGANTLLFIITMFNSWMHSKAAKNPNPHVFSRSIMAATAIKLFALGGAAIIYLFVAGSNRSVLAIFAGMGLYIIYTILEVRIALQLNKK